MSQTVFSKVIRRFGTVYGTPNVPDQNALYDEFCKALGGYSASILENAVDAVIRNHEYPTWPTVGEVVKAARAFVASTFKPDVSPPVVEWPPPTPEQKARADHQQRQMHLSAIGNSFVDIQRRCPRGGSINIAAPWGEEVRDSGGNIIPIRKHLTGSSAP